MRMSFTRYLRLAGPTFALLTVCACSGAPSPTGAIASGTLPGGSGNPGGPSMPGSPGPAPAVALDSEEQAFVGLINAYRAQNGLAALKVSIALTESSKWMSNDMATKNYFDHTDSLGRDPFTRMAAFGYSYSGSSGENIAAGNAAASDTFTQWKNSPPHNANMLDSSYTVIGVGRAQGASSTYGWYWTTDFGSYVDATL